MINDLIYMQFERHPWDLRPLPAGDERRIAQRARRVPHVEAKKRHDGLSIHSPALPGPKSWATSTQRKGNPRDRS